MMSRLMRILMLPLVNGVGFSQQCWSHCLTFSSLTCCNASRNPADMKAQQQVNPLLDPSKVSTAAADAAPAAARQPLSQPPPPCDSLPSVGAGEYRDTGEKDKVSGSGAETLDVGGGGKGVDAIKAAAVAVDVPPVVPPPPAEKCAADKEKEAGDKDDEVDGVAEAEGEKVKEADKSKDK